MVFPLKHHGLPTKENEGYFWLLIKNPLPLFNKNPTTFSDFFKLNSAQAARKDLVSLAGRLFCGRKRKKLQKHLEVTKILPIFATSKSHKRHKSDVNEAATSGIFCA